MGIISIVYQYLRRLVSVFILFTGFVSTAHAHVKWFAPYDLEQPPLSINQILTQQYLYFYIGSAIFIYCFFLFDRFCYRHGFLRDVLTRYAISEKQTLILLRVSVLIFFVAVAAYGFYDQPFLLTPELKTDLVFIPWLQLAIALFALHRKTLPLIGLGIILLYVFATAIYGVFHTLDYFIFLGVAYFFLASSKQGQTSGREHGDVARFNPVDPLLRTSQKKVCNAKENKVIKRMENTVNSCRKHEEQDNAQPNQRQGFAMQRK